MKLLIQPPEYDALKNIGIWFAQYITFILIAVFIVYYLKPEIPQTFLLKDGYYYQETVGSPKDLLKKAKQIISLPDLNTAKEQDRKEGWYEIPIKNTARLSSEKRLSIYIPSLNQNAEIFLNEFWLGNGGHMNDPVDRNHANPLIFNLSNEVLKSNDNRLYIHLKGVLPEWTHLGTVYFGPEKTLRQAYKKQLLTSVYLVVLSTFALVFTSLITALLWFLRRNKEGESYYLWYSLGALLWSFHNTKLIVNHVPISDSFWESLMTLAIGWSVICFVFFNHRYTSSYNKKIDRCILWAAIALTVPFAYQDLEWVVFYGYKIWIVFVLFSGLYVAGFLLNHFLKTKDSNILKMLLAGMVMIAFGVHDWLLVIGVLPSNAPRIMPISALITIAVISSFLMRRFVASLEDVETYNRKLELQVAKKEDQLTLEFKKTQKLQKAQTLYDERERIMRDIHDGMGGQLITTLVALENPDITIPQIKENISTALRDLRMVIDSLDSDDQDLTVILATLRMRVETLLTQAKIRLIWKVEDLPDLGEFGPEKALHTMRIVQEAITNVIKHSGASELTISAYPESVGDQQVAVILVADNGCGMLESVSTDGRGMSNMTNRASKIGATFRTSSREKGGTVIRLVFHRDKLS